MHICRLLLAVNLLFLAGCSAVEPYAAQAPAWHTDIIAQVYHFDAAAVEPESGATAWADGVHIYFRTTAGETPGVIVLGRTPWGVTLLPGGQDHLHLLWQDVDDYGEPYLYSAYITPTGELRRGPITLSAAPIHTFTAAPAGNGRAVVLWSDADPRPTLYGQAIDAQGRPMPSTQTQIAANADYPALNRAADGTWALAWLGLPDAPHQATRSRSVMVAFSGGVFPWDALPDPAYLGRADLPELTLFVDGLRLGLDHAYGYVFISLQDAATASAWTELFTFPLAAPTPAQTQHTDIATLPNNTSGTATIATGFNTGPAYPPPAADADLRPAIHPAPVWGQYAVLPIAWTTAEGLALGYFQDGGLIGWQPIAAGEHLIGWPRLWVDRDRYLSVSWSNHNGDIDAPADLLLSPTRPHTP